MDIELLARKFYETGKYMRGYTPATLRAYKGVIGRFLIVTQLERIEDVNETNVREFFLNGRMEHHWTTPSYINYYRGLNVFFTWCITNHYMAANPLSVVELPKHEKRLPKKLSNVEAMTLLNTVYNYPYENSFHRYRNHAIFCMFMFAGLRKEELLHLRLTDVDVENMTIFVNQGKGSKDRIIPMSFTLAESLKRYLIVRKKKGITCPEFFASYYKNKGYTKSGLMRLIIKLRKASGLQFSAHKLRHTFATLMLEGGCDIYSLSRMMGHSDIKTTTIYLSASAEHLRSQMTKHPLNNLVL
ncbi:MAG: tyrosine-type recombinase/integrase [Bacteroidetes bacterium]|nr:tyrosine-type recombinase/integrase [Bacteroidota bacterium]